MDKETNQANLRHEISLQQSRLFRVACELIVLAGAGLYLEGALTNGPADSLAGIATAAIGAVVYFSHGEKNPSKSL